MPSIYQKARAIGLRKSAAFLATAASGRLTKLSESGAPYRFKPGFAPANKGLRRPGWHAGRMRETQFRKGNRPWTWVPIGSTRTRADGYLERKMTDTGYTPRDWVCVHQLLWREHHGPIPPGHAVVFRDGDRSPPILLSNLECISRAELARRNRMWNRYPKAIAQSIQLLGALNRKINRKTRNEEQDRGSAESPVRHAGGATRQGGSDGHRQGKSSRRGRRQDHRLGEGGGPVP
jgi:hypothetical protein